MAILSWQRLFHSWFSAVRPRAGLRVLMLATFWVSRASSADMPEYQVKAAFLYNFTQFVEWPETAFTSETAPLVIGILGDDPFKGSLEELVHGEQVKHRSLVIEHYQRIDEVHSCHILFI